MDNFIEKIDQSIVIAINGWHTPFLDEIMWIISSKLVWIPFYLFLIYLAAKKISLKQTLFFTILAVLSVVISDLISTHCFKEVFLRYRPSHNLLLTEKLHFYENKPGEFYQGGQYGFISSHAANFFAIAIFVGYSLKNYYPKLLFILITISTIVCLSRIYLGVHYLSDVFVGGLVGATIAFLLSKFIFNRFRENPKLT
jgi:undecaprenyl-diphosphatase